VLIKNLIFDLGGVVLNIDYDGPSKALAQMGITNFYDYYSKAKQDNIFNDFEKGLISPAQFRENINKFFNLKLSDKELDAIWNAIILNFPKENIELLLSLRKHYKTYLLSNTNKIHFDFYTEQLRVVYGITWEDLFDNVFFSHEMGLRKPDFDMYNKALEQAGINAQESLFVDDLIVNIESAKNCGIHTIWFKDTMKLSDIFSIRENGIRLHTNFIR